MMIDLETFFEEKDIPFTSWEIKHGEETHIIDSDYVIQSILSTRGEERTKIGAVLFKLDFHNAPIVPYLKFLAECLIKERFKND